MMIEKWMVIIVWLIWVIGFPIYKKIKKEPVFENNTYALGACLLTLIIDLL